MNTANSLAENLFYRAVRLMEEGDTVTAEAELRLALELQPDMAEAHANLGWLLEHDAHPREAERHYRRALEIQPQQIQTYLNFGAMLNVQKRFAEAEAIYRQALAIAPDMPEALSNFGVLLACMKREQEAEQCYRRALAIAPDYRTARFNLAYLLLRHGDYDEGWHCLEARKPSVPLQDKLSCPRWNGEPLHGKSILIGFEAGHGDMIQFCRYATMLKQQGAQHVDILCHPGLKTLFARLPGADDIIGLDEALPNFAWDYWTLPMSLPYFFGTRHDTIPAALPYLSAAPERIAHWQNIIGAHDGRLRVGLVWKGNHHNENDAERSLPSLAALAPLADISGVRFFSLQKGQAAAEAALAPVLPLTDLAAGIADFDDTAAIVAQMDLVIAVDTAVAHLAGALGKQCWVLIPDYKADWRWLADTDASPWYPQVMRLFRQHAMGDWAPTIAEVAQALSALAQAETGR
ncbi:MAG TPA: tetratricopeptide repeat protein [Oxalicibacterium sp.]|nr:tetratricopeptide repeat protein [Oxalicibacterium sp.]